MRQEVLVDHIFAHPVIGKTSVTPKSLLPQTRDELEAIIDQERTFPEPDRPASPNGDQDVWLDFLLEDEQGGADLDSTVAAIAMSSDMPEIDVLEGLLGEVSVFGRKAASAADKETLEHANQLQRGLRKLLKTRLAEDIDTGEREASRTPERQSRPVTPRAQSQEPRRLSERPEVTPRVTPRRGSVGTGPGGPDRRRCVWTRPGDTPWPCTLGG